MHALGGVEREAEGVLAVAVNFLVEGRVEGEDHLVVVAAFLVVESLPAVGFALAVHVVHSVPVDLSVCLGAGPEVHEVVVLSEEVRVLGEVFRIVLFGVVHVEDGARQVLVVVRSGGVGIAAPAECGGAVHRVLEAGGRGELLGVVDFPVPGEDGRGLEVVHHAGVALLPSLVAPVGVVVVGVGEPVGLLGRGTLLGAFRGRAEGDEAQGVVVVEAFLGSEEVGEGVVERSFNHALGSPAVAHLPGEGPARREDAGGVGVHAACHVVAVAAREGQLVALGKLRGAGVDARAAAHAHDADAVEVVGREALLVAGGIVHAAHHAVAEASQLEVVQLQAVEVVAVVHVVVGAHLEAHGAEQVAHLRVVRVALGSRDGRYGLGRIVVLVELALREGKVSVVEDRQGVGGCLRQRS